MTTLCLQGRPLQFNSYITSKHPVLRKKDLFLQPILSLILITALSWFFFLCVLQSHLYMTHCNLNIVGHAWLNSWKALQMWLRSPTEYQMMFQAQLSQCMLETKGSRASVTETQWPFSACTYFSEVSQPPEFCSLKFYSDNWSLCFLLVRIPAPLENKENNWSSTTTGRKVSKLIKAWLISGKCRKSSCTHMHS